MHITSKAWDTRICGMSIPDDLSEMRIKKKIKEK